LKKKVLVLFLSTWFSEKQAAGSVPSPPPLPAETPGLLFVPSWGKHMAGQLPWRRAAPERAVLPGELGFSV